MTDQITHLVSAVVVGGAAFQAFLCGVFLVLFRRQKKFDLPLEYQHATAVLICVRGCDPTLEQTICGVLDQDFDDYSVHVVVDHRTDDAWDLLHQLKEQHDHHQRLHIHEMPPARKDSGLKCQALVCGLNQLELGTQYVALLDADARPHRTWLRELTGPLVDPSIGVSTGNQWFEPTHPASWGSLTRSLWNAGALIPTVFFQNPWAGSLAMRMEDVRKGKLEEVWRETLVDDGPIRDVFQRLGLKVHFSPSILMVNREQATLPFVRQWIGRMLTWSRLYERTFFATVIHAIISSSILLAAICVFLINAITGNWFATLLSGGGLLVSGMFSLLGWSLARAAAQRSCQLQGQSLPRIPLAQWPRMLILIMVAQLFYAIGCLRALFCSHVCWREITYDVASQGSFQMMDYQPMSREQSERSEVSI